MLATIVLGAAGTPLVMAGCVLLARYLGTRPATVPAGLLQARKQLIDSLGPGGACLTLYGAGMFIVTAAGIILGELLQRIEHPVDWAVYHWVEDVQHEGWAGWMDALGKMGNTWPTRYTAIAAIVILTIVAFAQRRRVWPPALLLGGSVLVQRFGQEALAEIVDRGHPPTTLGTYPSGGCARILAIYGVIMFLALAYLRAGRLVRRFGWSLIVTMAFVEGYTRTYLNKHWVTDVLGGWAIGGLMLMVAVFAGRALLANVSPLGRPDGTVRGGTSPQPAAT